MANGVNRSEKLLSQVELGLSMGTENDETSSPPNKSELRQKTFWGLTHRQTTLGIAVMEVLLSSCCAGLFLYSAQNYQQVVKPILHLYLPECLTDKMIVGLLNSVAFFNGIECILGAWLFESIKRNKLQQILSWLLILVTYESVILIFNIFLGFQGCSTDQINIITFFRLFFRFIEFLVIFIFVEDESMKRMKLKGNAVRRSFMKKELSNLQIHSNATSLSYISCCEDILENEMITEVEKIAK